MTKIDNGRIHKGKEYDKKKLHIKNNIFFWVVAGVRTSDLAYIMHCPYQLS